MSLIKSSMKSLSTFKLVDIIIFETYLLFVGLLLAKLITWILGLGLWFYVVISVIGLIYLLFVLVFKNDGKSKNLKSIIDRFHKLTIWQISIYKIVVVFCGLALMKVFPELMNIDIAWYTVFFGFGAGYFVKMIWIK